LREIDLLFEDFSPGYGRFMGVSMTSTRAGRSRQAVARSASELSLGRDLGDHVFFFGRHDESAAGERPARFPPACALAGSRLDPFNAVSMLMQV